MFCCGEGHSEPSVFQERRCTVHKTQPRGVKYYVAFVMFTKLLFIVLALASNHIYLQYLTNEVYLLVTTFYILLFLYLCGIEELYFVTFHILFPLVYGLSFSIVILLIAVVFTSSYLFEHSVDGQTATIGQLYLIDHILHTFPFINMLITAFMLGKYTVLSPKHIVKQIHYTDGYDISNKTLKQKDQIRKKDHMSIKQSFWYCFYVFYYFTGPAWVIYAYMWIIPFEESYGKMFFGEFMNDLLVLLLSVFSGFTLLLISIYRISEQKNRKK